MGRVRGKMIRLSTLEILKRYRNQFTDNYDANKKILNELVYANKTTRNKIAGFITSLSKAKKIEE